jgi:hypothetical protein
LIQGRESTNWGPFGLVLACLSGVLPNTAILKVVVTPTSTPADYVFRDQRSYYNQDKRRLGSSF